MPYYFDDAIMQDVTELTDSHVVYLVKLASGFGVRVLEKNDLTKVTCDPTTREPVGYILPENYLANPLASNILFTTDEKSRQVLVNSSISIDNLKKLRIPFTSARGPDSPQAQIIPDLEVTRFNADLGRQIHNQAALDMDNGLNLGGVNGRVFPFIIPNNNPAFLIDFFEQVFRNINPAPRMQPRPVYFNFLSHPPEPSILGRIRALGIHLTQEETVNIIANPFTYETYYQRLDDMELADPGLPMYTRPMLFEEPQHLEDIHRLLTQFRMLNQEDALLLWDHNPCFLALKQLDNLDITPSEDQIRRIFEYSDLFRQKTWQFTLIKTRVRLLCHELSNRLPECEKRTGIARYKNTYLTEVIMASFEYFVSGDPDMLRNSLIQCENNFAQGAGLDVDRYGWLRKTLRVLTNAILAICTAGISMAICYGINKNEDTSTVNKIFPFFSATTSRNKLHKETESLSEAIRQNFPNS